MENQKKVELQKIATKIRLGALEEIFSASSGHPGGSLSIADILSYLYFDKMNIDPQDPKNADRDRLVLSKGHTAPALYATLAHRGFFSTELLKTFRHKDSILQGHPDMKHIPGVDMSSGSLGQGISAACGIALSGKLDKKSYRVYTILGDGELEEGQVWEAAMFAAHYKLNNLCAFIDFNGLQIDGDITKVMNPTPIDEKFKAFGWNVTVIDGHDLDAIEKAVAESEKSDKPFAVICKCIKGKGVSFMENDAGWHGNAPNAEQYETAKSELEAYLASLN
ncbi:MAG: transketolase [Clostridia bacterium]|nr:transketolase [Clostridia bacterium]